MLLWSESVIRMCEFTSDNPIYSEVDAITTGKESFSMVPNNCYGSKPAKGKKSSNYGMQCITIVLLTTLIIAFLLGAVVACITFSLQIYELKSETASIKAGMLKEVDLQNVTSFTQQVTQELNVTSSALDAFDSKIQELNTSLSTQLNQVLSIQELSTMLGIQLNQSRKEWIQELNISVNTSETYFQDLNASLHIQLNEDREDFNGRIQELNASLSTCKAKSEELNTSLHTQLNEDLQAFNRIIQDLNNSLTAHKARFEEFNISLHIQLNQDHEVYNGRIQELHTLLSTQVNQSSGFVNSLGILENRTSLILSALSYGQDANFPTVSCASLPPSSPSGYYWVQAFNGSAVRAYCDMTRSCGGVTGGWMRVAELDMANSSHQCPSGLMLRNDSGLRTCVRNQELGGCSSLVNFVLSAVSYTKVCGRIIGYQYFSTDAFFNPRNIDSPLCGWCKSHSWKSKRTYLDICCST